MSIPSLTRKAVITLQVALGLLLVCFSGPIASADSRGSDRTRVVDSYGKLPLSFEANHGQTDKQVKFLSRGSGYALFLTPTEAVLSLRTGHGQQGKKDSVLPASTAPKGTHSEAAVLRIRLEHANSNTKVSGIDELGGKDNYFIGNDPRKWQTGVPTYARVKYEGIYPGIDLVYHGSGQQQLEYDFVVAPNANPKLIELSFQGSDGVQVDSRGNLLLRVAGIEVVENAPVIYQEIDGRRTRVVGSYALSGEHSARFRIAEYDRRRPLIIDPVLVYSTYLGGSSYEQGRDIAVDSAGNAYVIGSTNSANFPTTTGVLQTTSAGQFDIYLTKLNSSGSAQVYSTYVGGSDNDYGDGLAIDSLGNAYLTGQTLSSNFPTTTGAFQTTFGGGQSDAFVTKLNSSGSALVYSTRLGGNGDDRCDSIAVDFAGNAYVTGLTNSSNFPTSTGAFQITYGGSLDAFVTKLNSSGSALVYSTYLGGSALEEGFRIAVDLAGNAYVTGYTRSSNFPTTAGAFQTIFGGSSDAFVTKLNFNGSALVYSTYLGGSADESGDGIAVDLAGNAYVTGNTSSTNFSTTTGAFQTTFGGVRDAFVTKLNSIGSALVYSTYLGGGADDSGADIAVDSAGNAYVTGYTYSSNFPTSAGAFQTTLGGSSDAFVTQLSPSGSALIYSTYFGGSALDEGNRISVDSAGKAYVVGDTQSTNFPTTTGAFQTSLGGSQDAFVAKIGSAGERAAYVANSGSNTVSVIKTADDTVLATVPVGPNPANVAVTPDGTKAYVTNAGANSVSVINTGNNTVSATVTVGPHPVDVAVTPDGTKAYVTNAGANSVSVINTSMDLVAATVLVGNRPADVAITPNGTKAYVTNVGSNSVSVINTGTNVVVATVPVGRNPSDMAITPDGAKAYVANTGTKSVSVINTSTDLVAATVLVGNRPADVAITPNGTKAYVTNAGSNSVSVINTGTDTVPTTVNVGPVPVDVVITPDGTKAYVTNAGANSVSVINTSTDTVLTTVTVGSNPVDTAITGNGAKAYVTNAGSNSVSVINTSLNNVGTTVSVGGNPTEVVLH
jgi:YVTN family beta-propeller protein